MSMEKKVVVGESGITAPQMKDFWTMVERRLIDGRVLTYIKEHIYEIRAAAQIPWWERILEKESGYHWNFVGKKFNLSTFQAVIEKYSREKVECWQSLGLEVHFLPEISMFQNDKYPGWEKKPGDWYYNQIVAGKILRLQPDGQLKPIKEVKLEGITVLIDTRLKPAYNNGKQMFKNDNLLGPIIERLREKGEIADYNPRSSRFNVSAEEWQDRVRPALAVFLGVDVSQVRLETAIEANVIPQLYPYMPRKNDGRTDVWVWYEEFFGDASSHRLHGGFSAHGVLSHVPYYSVGSHWYDGAFRPLVVLSP